jgi:5-methylthioadenosine/S-adenosylhomocysteine deaminase
MLIKGASALCGSRLVKGQDILLDGGRIAAIGKDLDVDRGEEVLDGRGKLAIPGLINSHTHLAMTLFRGYADDMELQPWLEQKIWPLEAHLEPEDVRAGARLGCLELIRAGITCFCDMYLFPDETALAAKEMGLRAVVGAGVYDMRPSLLKGAEQFICRWSGDDLVTPAIGPHAINTCSEETLLSCKNIAEKNDCIVHMHLAETRQEVEDCQRMRRMSPVGYLDSLGLLSARLLAAHCIWVSDADIALLARKNVSVSHCPVSNHKLVSGFAPVEKLRCAGIRVSLGTDGASSNNSLNIFQEMKVAAISEKCIRGSPTAVPAGVAFDMATKNAYSTLNLPMGLYPGALADIALIDMQKPWFYPETNIVSHLVYSMTGGVDTTIVNGRVLMRNGVIPEESRILAKAQERFEDLIA